MNIQRFFNESFNFSKTFFRRTIVSEQTFICQYNGNCDVNKNIRCACRHCRFNKCLAVGMDAKAIQNDRDRIGPTKKAKLSSKLRRCVMRDVSTVQQALSSPCLLFETPELTIDPSTVFKELYPASMNDIRMWNIREMRICIEWGKTFDAYQRLSHFDQVQLSGCRPIYTRQMDEIMLPFRRLQLSVSEFATFKAALFFNPDALDLSSQAKPDVYEERNKYLSALFTCITNKLGMAAGVQKYGSLLMMTASIQNILAQNEENMQVMELFKNWEVDPFVKELCMKRA
ncbi:unnamed protein product [Nippostrongylus brasiliensis]|uniref:Nuclear hormone receptor family member nhr-1 (inferred by orthology to a C. elegans protein) n=1 Tax=Nippostrongylus brasiliensis TaxID=27835 RepID=A0A0N4YP61_NIPBR|nr:unnamed protein product [Nippostrongylus brasiliensis]